VKLSKRARANTAIREKIAAAGPQALREAVKVLKQFKGPKFDQTVEVCVHLGIDDKVAEQKVRGSISMPRGVGKTARVVCFCPADKVEAAKKAGALEAGAEDLVEKIAGGWMDFDVAVATPDMMKVVSKVARLLGPKGLMPSPKAGTVTPDIATAVKEYSGGKLEYRNDVGGNVHCIIGKMSFSEDDLVANLEHFIATIQKVKPASAKGQYIRKCVISGTMTPGVPIAVAS
jgi:large subunit ribosomal protein L1